jgi:hypothetical protein
MSKHMPTIIKPWVLHDLRRTARSLMSRAGVAPEVAEKCLAHLPTGIQGTYDRWSYLPERRAALEALAASIDGIVNTTANVVPLRRVALRGSRVEISAERGRIASPRMRFGQTRNLGGSTPWASVSAAYAARATCSTSGRRSFNSIPVEPPSKGSPPTMTPASKAPWNRNCNSHCVARLSTRSPA